jgi:hypothetical protein
MFGAMFLVPEDILQISGRVFGLKVWVVKTILRWKAKWEPDSLLGKK